MQRWTEAALVIKQTPLSLALHLNTSWGGVGWQEYCLMLPGPWLSATTKEPIDKYQTGSTVHVEDFAMSFAVVVETSDQLKALIDRA